METPEVTCTAAIRANAQELGNKPRGHVHNICAKVNGEKRWMACNCLRGQYMRALEHSVPEWFFNDPSQCNLQDTATPMAGLPDCPHGISAVKALGIAGAHGQRIYTITQRINHGHPSVAC
ncbi:hypothetical protein [Acidovorax kalamii]|uniref:hypothetical protein n=1 Tax=Acidovorax kalamii TaxID=2004485 RepID=UPI001056C37F|nr:hypothetical protein [Acidovorax kalamii]